VFGAGFSMNTFETMFLVMNLNGDVLRNVLEEGLQSTLTNCHPLTTCIQSSACFFRGGYGFSPTGVNKILALTKQDLMIMLLSQILTAIGGIPCLSCSSVLVLSIGKR
jgi:hypothetical protein